MNFDGLTGTRRRTHEQLLLLSREDYRVRPRLVACAATPAVPEGHVALEGVRILEARERALRVALPSGRRLYVPREHVHPASSVLGPEGEGTLVLPAWLAKRLSA